MSKKDNFFIGWQGKTTADHKRSLRRLLIPIFVAIPLVIFALVYFTKPFSNGIFELGNVKEFTGVYYESPFPSFLLDEGQLENGSSTSALLVGFGKNGANTFMSKAKEKEGQLSGHRLKIQGTLIYSDGKTLIELTKKEKSVLEVMEPEVNINPKPRISKVSLKGEIIDPKCWFGVMKPAEGKVHKSCAIRCISGGIPPVLKTELNGVREYYILKGMDNEDINDKVLEFVGENIELQGQSYSVNGWNVMRVDTREFKYVK